MAVPVTPEPAARLREAIEEAYQAWDDDPAPMAFGELPRYIADRLASRVVWRDNLAELAETFWKNGESMLAAGSRDEARVWEQAKAALLAMIRPMGEHLDGPRPIELVRHLDEALHDESWARQTSPGMTWKSLLGEVRALRVKRDSLQHRLGAIRNAAEDVLAEWGDSEWIRPNFEAALERLRRLVGE